MSKVFNDKDRMELKEKLKAAIFHRLEPKCEYDRALINSEALPRLIDILIEL